jgi:uncharacterized membrane protein
MPIDLLSVSLRILHILAAVAAAGGAIFQIVALHPTLATLGDESRRTLRSQIVDRWRVVVVLAIIVLLVTGLVNFIAYAIPDMKESPHKMLYHGVFGLKFLAALAAFHNAAVLVLPGPRGERYRDHAGFWLKLMVTMFVVIIICGAILRELR